MKNSKLSFWIVILVGVMGIVASILAYVNGEKFLIYFLSGFSGAVLITTAIVSKNKRKKSV